MNDYNTTESDDGPRIEKVNVSAYTIPTETPEADGTYQWDSTTLVLVELQAAGKNAIGYTYATGAAAHYIVGTLAPLVTGKNPFDTVGITASLRHRIRNDGDTGIAAMAVSAVDSALWDLKAKIFGVPLYVLLGAVHDHMLLYGSGGFTNYSDEQLARQFSGWAASGIRYMKMKIGTDPVKDRDRVKHARRVIGDDLELFVDANGAYTVKQSVEKARVFGDFNVTWFEEPVTSDNLDGLAFIRDHTPGGMNIAAGEYGYNLPYFRQMVAHGSVDVLQADATRCGGITGFLKAGILAEAYQLPFSSHCAPALHLHAALALPSFFVAEYFFDHARIESILFDGVSPPDGGVLRPDPQRPGLGLEFKYQDAAKYKL